MSVVTQITDWPRPQVRLPQTRREGTAEIHILPCVRREPIAAGERQLKTG